jgi:hypothetical protein
MLRDLVSVLEADKGRQVANGMTDPVTGLLPCKQGAGNSGRERATLHGERTRSTRVARRRDYKP